MSERTESPSHIELAVAALLALTEHGIPADIQELLVHGSKQQGVRPGALSAAVKAILAALGGQS